MEDMCRHVLVEWVKAWPEAQGWKHEVRWQDDGVAVLSQRLEDGFTWHVTNIFPRTQLESGSPGLVKWRALQAWKELHIAIRQQGEEP